MTVEPPPFGRRLHFITITSTIILEEVKRGERPMARAQTEELINTSLLVNRLRKILEGEGFSVSAVVYLAYRLYLRRMRQGHYAAAFTVMLQMCEEVQKRYQDKRSLGALVAKLCCRLILWRYQL